MTLGVFQVENLDERLADYVSAHNNDSKQKPKRYKYHC